MYETFVALSLMLFGWLTAGANLGHGRGQNPPSTAQGPSLQEKRVAVDLVRLINTAEMTYRAQNGGVFAARDSLSASSGFKQDLDQISRMSPELGDLNLTTPSNIISGWGLRLALSPDAMTYVLVLANTADKQCSFAFVSEEDGIVRQATAIGCRAQ